MKDYGYESRQKLIASTFDLTTKAGRRRAFQYWVARGHSEAAASRASLYHPIEELDSALGKFVMGMVVLVALILMFILADSVYAANHLETSAINEEAFARCLSGEDIKFSDGSRWQCIKVGLK